MVSSLFKAVWSALGWLWWLLDAARQTLLNLLFLALLVALVWALARSGPPPLQPRTTLVLAPEGPIREQFAGSGLRASALQQLQGGRPARETRLRDLLTGLEAAGQDPNVERLLLITDDLAGAGTATLREVGAALDRFRAQGKQVIAWGSSFDQRQYFLAAHADEVWMHPMGSVEITGYGGARTYYKDALDQFGVTAHVVRAGQYKNAAETFVANGPSPQTQEEDKALYDALWASYAGGVERARKLDPGSLQAAIDTLPERLAEAGGDGARLALKQKWVDALKTRDQLRDALIERGVKDGKTFRQAPFGAVLARVRPPVGGPAVGVVVAEGGIVDGAAPAGTIGGLSTAELIRAAREDERIKALVLRVNSPGGSAFGAELVRRELELTRAAGKPVVVSMGDLAASGGYWISMAADEVIADEATITGSIGVVAMLPSVERGLEKLGVRTEGYGTSWLVGAYDIKSGLDPRLEKMIQLGVDDVYADFRQLVATARKRTPEQIDAVAQGRVWTGAQAKERALVDRNGSFGDAITAAVKRANLQPGWRLQYLDREPGRLERLLALVGQQASAVLGPPEPAPLPQRLLDGVRRDWAFLAEVSEGRKPFAALTHCLCGAP